MLWTAQHRPSRSLTLKRTSRRSLRRSLTRSITRRGIASSGGTLARTSPTRRATSSISTLARSRYCSSRAVRAPPQQCFTLGRSILGSAHASRSHHLDLIHSWIFGRLIPLVPTSESTLRKALRTRNVNFAKVALVPTDRFALFL